jgi:hypothetical protein
LAPDRDFGYCDKCQAEHFLEVSKTMKPVNSILKVLFASATVAAAVSATAQPVRALSFTTNSSPTGYLPGSQVIDFDSTFPASLSGGAIVPNSIPNTAIRPIGATGQFLSVAASSSTAGPATLSLGTLSSYYGLYWGSVDGDNGIINTLEFLRNGVSIATFTGDQVLDPANGEQGPGGSIYVNFFANGPTDYFDAIRLTSSNFAFESDNHAFRAIPTPALLPGLIGMGLAALRKRKDTETAGDKA